MSKQDDRNNTFLETPDTQGSGSPGDGYEMDAATRSVSNALRTSFLALKVVLLLLVVFYLGSGYFSVPPGSRAVVVQFGKIQGLDNPAGAVLQPGPHWMWPWPISDKIIKDMEKPNSLTLTSFWFALDDPRLVGLTIDEILKKAAPPEYMNPDKTGRLGYLLTGEQEIIHLQLAIKYRVDDLVAYVTRVADEQKLVRTSAEWACTQTVGRMRTDTVVRGEDDTLKGNLKRLMQQKLESQVGPALSVVDIIVDQRTVPLQVYPQYLAVVQAENEKLKVVSAARTKATQVLNEMAGPANEQLKQTIQAYGLARAKGETAAADEQMRQILALLDTVGGKVASTIGQAMADRSRQELSVRAEVQRFRHLYGEYQANPGIFIAQLWAEAKADIMDSPELEVIYLPFASKEIRMTLDHNPQFLKAREARKYAGQVSGG
jgi:regulator of protease activity HflC (stomatin/prohibitin superfamily)